MTKKELIIELIEKGDLDGDIELTVTGQTEKHFKLHHVYYEAGMTIVYIEQE